MRRLSGPLLIATGILDLLYVLVFHSQQLVAIVRSGFFDAVELDPAQLDREVAFWHLTFGMTVLILGGLVHWAQTRTGTLPAFVGWSLLALGLFGAILVPVSGFWLLLPLAVLVLAVSRRSTRGAREADAAQLMNKSTKGGNSQRDLRGLEAACIPDHGGEWPITSFPITNDSTGPSRSNESKSK